MDKPDLHPTPLPLIMSYPSAAAILLIALSTLVLLWAAMRIDRTGGTLTASLLVIITFVGVVAYCLVFSIPTDEINSTVIGGLATAFGAVIAFWLGRPREPPKKDPPSE